MLGGYDRTQYVSERLFADGARRRAVPISLVYRKGLAAGRLAPRCSSAATAPTGFPLPVTFSSDAPEPARPRLRLRPRPHPRRRRDGQALARRRAHDEEEEHLHRLHRRRRAPRGPQSYTSSDRLVDRRRQRGRPAHGRGHATCAPTSSRPSSRTCRSWTSSTRCSTRRCPSPSASTRSGATRRRRTQYDYMKTLLPLHEPRGQGLSRDAREDVVQRQPGHVLGAGQVRGQAAHAQDRREPARS